MHGSWGNTIDAQDAFARMGADVMRWQYCAQPPDRNLLFGFGPAHEIQRKLLTLWNSATFLVDYANVEGFAPLYDDLERGPDGDLQPLDRWLVERTRALVARRDGRLRALAHGRRDPRVRGVRRRSLELVHPPLTPAVLGRRRARAAHALVRARRRRLRVIAPRDAVPRRAPLAALVREACEGAPRSRPSRRLARGAPSPTRGCSPRSPRSAASSSLGHQARQAAGLKLRQPLRELVVEGAAAREGPCRRDRARSCG